MKLLTLIRHAKSDWDDHAVPDHDRPLNERGRAAAPMMGRILAEKGLVPGVIFSSSAKRACSTAKKIAKELGIPKKDIVVEPKIYAAGVPALLKVLRGIDESVESAALVGHNPGMEDLAATLLADHSISHLPTCAVVQMKLEVDHWAEVCENCAELVEHLYPRMFE